VSHSQPDGDNGGNAVLLCSSPCVQELHGFWDGALGNDEAPIGLLIDAASVHVPGGSHATDLDPKHWATESLTLARSDVYKAPIGLGAGPFTINTAYVQNAQRVASERVALAAARLANILKTDLQ